MARYKASKSPDPISISQWLGVNESVGLTGLKLGESLRQVNYRTTKDFKLEKRKGHKTIADFSNTKDVQGMWKGQLEGKAVLIAINDGKIYEFEESELNA